MSTNVIHDLVRQAPVVTDGAWGTQLEALGLAPGECPDGWNLTHPDEVEKVARAYVEAGSRVILTNTFRSNRIALEGFGLGDKVVQINRAGAAISKKAASNRALVFASIGPTGKMLVMGDVTKEQLSAAFVEQAQALAEGGADAIVVETMADTTEAAAAVTAVKAVGLPVVGCMVYDSGRNKDRTMMGTTLEQAVEALVEAGADAIGANCGQGIEAFLPICRRLVAATDRPIWIKANAGLPVLVEGRTTYPIDPQAFAAHAGRLCAQGASFIGGCCGTNPDFIAAIRAALDSSS